MREVAPPTAEPLTLDEVRIHLRQYADAIIDSPPLDPELDTPPDDSWVEAKITAARIFCEDFLGYPLTDAVYEIAQSAFVPPLDWRSCRLRTVQSGMIELPYNTTQVVSVSYLDADNVSTTIDPAGYYFDDFGFGLYPVSDWPSDLSTRTNGVRIRFRGMTSDDSPAPYVDEAIKQAMLLLIGNWYELREAVVVGSAANEVPFAVEALLRPKRVRLGMA